MLIRSVKPRVLQQLLRWRPDVRIYLQHLSYQLPCPCRYSILISISILANAYESVELLLASCPERQHSHHHDVQHHSKSPNICFCSNVRLFLDYLRRHVCRSATICCQHHSWVSTETKIDYLDEALLVYQDIFRLQISMANSTLVTVGNSFQHLPHKFFALPLWQYFLLSHQSAKTMLPSIF